MLITLNNFKCWKQLEYDLGNQGITLLSGKSGVGKTSIIEAIIFALFGTGRKITKIGEKSCSVKLTTQWRSNQSNNTPDNTYNQNIEIFRQKGPNRLTVMLNNILYEDDSAQALIDNEYTDTFNSIGYLSQSSVNSFVLMGPQDKLAFLEKLVFKNMDMKIIKNKISTLIRERNTLLQQTTGKIDMLNQIITEIIDNKSQTTEPNYPFECSENNREIFEKNLFTLEKNQNKKLNSFNSKLEKLKKMEEETTNYENQNHDLIEKQKLYQSKLNESNKYNIDFSDNVTTNQHQEQLQANINTNKQTINNYSKYLEYLETKLSINDLQEKLTSVTQKEEQQLQEKLQKYSTDILDDNTLSEIQEDIQTFSEYIQDIKQYNKFLDEIHTIDQEIVEINKTATDSKITLSDSFRADVSSKIETIQKKLTEQKLYGKKYKCPQCKTKLSICNDTHKLILINDSSENSQDIEKLKQKITRYKKLITLFDELYQKFNIMDSKKTDLIHKNQTISNNYEDFDNSPTNTTELTHDLKKYKTLLDKHTIASTEITKIKTTLSDPFFNNHIIKSMSRDIEKSQLKLDKIHSDNQNINELVSNNNIDSITCKNILDEHKLNLNQISNDLLTFNNCLSEYNTLTDKLNDINQKLEILQKTFSEKKPLSLKSIQKHISKILTEKDNLNDDINKNQQQIISLEKWKISYQQYLDFTKKQTELSELHDISSNLSKKLKSIYTIKDIIMKAESMTINNIINQINDTVSRYLDIFFPDNPIRVILHCPDTENEPSNKSNKKPIKQKTKERTQISILIDYKDIEADISILSGGELQRIVIAYNLALSELFNLPLILLDECTSNLDQELTEIVVKGIHRNCNDKMIIMIAHQVVSGIFDKVIQI